MENIEDMKGMWIDLNNRLSVLEDENRQLADKVARSGFKPSREKLENKYKRFIILETVMLLFCLLYFTNSPFFVPGSRWILTIYWTVMILAEIGIDLYLLHGVKSIDIMRDPIHVVAEKARRCQHVHNLFICFGLPIAFGGVGVFVWAMGDYSWELISGLVLGVVIGLAIGLRQYFDFMKAYKSLRSED